MRVKISVVAASKKSNRIHCVSAEDTGPPPYILYRQDHGLAGLTYDCGPAIEFVNERMISIASFVVINTVKY